VKHGGRVTIIQFWYSTGLWNSQINHFN